MFRIGAAGKTSEYCDGMSRRNFLQIGVIGMASVAMADVLRAQQASTQLGQAKKNTSVILVWLDGGPSHLDLYDMKPDAPTEYAGIWRPIRTNVSGIEISELFPEQAKIADKFSIVRSPHHNHAGHFPASRHMLTGRPDAVPGTNEAIYPSVASIATKMCGPRQPEMLPYVSVPVTSTIGLRPGHFGASYLGMNHNPFETAGDPNGDDFKMRNIKLQKGMSIDRLEDRQGLRKQFDRMRRDMEELGAFDAMDAFQYQALELVCGEFSAHATDEQGPWPGHSWPRPLGQCDVLRPWRRGA